MFLIHQPNDMKNEMKYLLKLSKLHKTTTFKPMLFMLVHLYNQINSKFQIKNMFKIEGLLKLHTLQIPSTFDKIIIVW